MKKPADIGKPTNIVNQEKEFVVKTYVCARLAQHGLSPESRYEFQ
jgi:hypothetical protein